jgi:hypothetical protein
MPATMPKFQGAIAGRHLGRKKPTQQMRAKLLPLAPFVKRMGAQPPPDVVDYTAKGKSTLAQMLGNDQYGDCTIAAVLHQGGVMTAEQPGGKERVPTTQEAVGQYPQICGPGDQGCYIPDVMNWWRDRGLSVGGQTVKSDGYVSLTLGDQLLAKVALYLFGPLHFGINLPNDWYVNASPGFVWDKTTSRIVGGHSIAIPGYDTNGFKASTWGTVGSMTFGAFADPQWVEEIYAVLSPDWYDKGGLDEHGVNVQALKDALAAIAAGGTPDIPPEPTPPGPFDPPGPNPNPNAHEWSHTFTAFGKALRIYAGYELSDAQMQHARSFNWGLLPDIWALVKAVEAKDLTQIASAAAKILADLGIVLPWSKVEAFSRGVLAYHDTQPLAEPYPPKKVDTGSERR